MAARASAGGKELPELRAALERAVRRENYTLAAALKREIERLDPLERAQGDLSTIRHHLEAAVQQEAYQVRRGDQSQFPRCAQRLSAVQLA